MEWDFGSGRNTISVDQIPVDDGERHEVINKYYTQIEDLNFSNI